MGVRRFILLGLAWSVAASLRSAEIEINGGEIRIQGNIMINGGELIQLDQGEGRASNQVESSEPDPAGEHTLELTDGSALHGRLVSFGKSELVWQRADASATIIFPPSDVRRIVLGRSVPVSKSVSDATIKLPGGDWLTGKLSAFAGGKFTIDIGADAPLAVDRNLVEWMYLSKFSPDAFEGPRGPAGIADWVQGVAGSWDYTDDSLIARQTSPITRSFAVLPDRMDIQFTANDGGNQNRGLTLWIQPEGRLSGYAPGSVYLRFQSDTVSVNSYDGSSIKSLNNTFKQDATRQDKVSRYRLLFDRITGRMQIRINGASAADWTLPMPTKTTGDGGALTFQPSYWTSDMPWTLSNVKVQPWDGDSLPDGDPEHAGKDILKAGGTERKIGTLEALTAESVRFSGRDFPRREQLFIRPARQATEPVAGAVARVWLAQRGEFDVLGIGFKDGVLKVRTAFAGDLSLPVSALKALQFPHRQNALADDATDSADTLVFTNGDQLKGKLVAAANDQRLLWKPAKGSTEVQFETKFVAGVQLARQAAASAAGGMAVRWQNGDWLSGALLALDDNKLAVQTAVLGRVEIARAGLSALYFGGGDTASVWDGASDSSKWMEGAVAPGFWNANRAGRKGEKKPTQWAYFDGSYTLKSPSSRVNGEALNLGRVFETLPDKCEVSFTILSTAASPAFTAQFFFDDNKPGIMVQSSGDFAYLYDMSPRVARGIGNMQQQQVEFGSAAGEAGKPRRYSFFCERSKGRFAMAVNGRLVGSLKSKGSVESPKPGRSFSVTPQVAGGGATVSELWVGGWTGILPPPVEKAAKAVPAPLADSKGENAPAEPPPAEVAGPQDSIALANGDETHGTVTKANAESIFIQCDVGEIEIPTKRASVAQFAPTPVQPRVGIRIRLATGGAVTVDKYRIDGGTLTCSASNIGEIKLPLEKITELIFTPGTRSPFAGSAKAAKSGMDAINFQIKRL